MKYVNIKYKIFYIIYQPGPWIKTKEKNFSLWCGSNIGHDHGLTFGFLRVLFPRTTKDHIKTQKCKYTKQLPIWCNQEIING